MFGLHVWRLKVKAERDSGVQVLFHKDGNYGDNWNYKQVTIKETTEQTVSVTNRK